MAAKRKTYSPNIMKNPSIPTKTRLSICFKCLKNKGHAKTFPHALPVEISLAGDPGAKMASLGLENTPGITSNTFSKLPVFVGFTLLLLQTCQTLWFSSFLDVTNNYDDRGP